MSSFNNSSLTMKLSVCRKLKSSQQVHIVNGNTMSYFSRDAAMLVRTWLSLCPSVLCLSVKRVPYEKPTAEISYHIEGIARQFLVINSGWWGDVPLCLRISAQRNSRMQKDTAKFSS